MDHTQRQIVMESVKDQTQLQHQILHKKQSVKVEIQQPDSKIRLKGIVLENLFIDFILMLQVNMIYGYHIEDMITVQ